ncbi:MAG: alanine acetyltransferase [Anabaena sp. LE011-02]|nr:MAG: alanine acetyltransferase [Anabaena sp. LE011-02]
MTSEPPILTSDRLILRMAVMEDIPYILKYFTENKEYLTPFYPQWDENFFTDDYWEYQVETSFWEFVNNYSLKLFIYRKHQPRQIVGTANFSNFIYSAAQFCQLGYSLAESAQGYGYMTEALSVSIGYIFQELNFHRIMANYMPHNRRSGNVLKRAGFVVEGYARDYLMINGKWEDHIFTSLTNPHWRSHL